MRSCRRTTSNARPALRTTWSDTPQSSSSSSSRSACSRLQPPSRQRWRATPNHCARLGGGRPAWAFNISTWGNVSPKALRLRNCLRLNITSSCRICPSHYPIIAGKVHPSVDGNTVTFRVQRRKFRKLQTGHLRATETPHNFGAVILPLCPGRFVVEHCGRAIGTPYFIENNESISRHG